MEKLADKRYYDFEKVVRVSLVRYRSDPYQTSLDLAKYFVKDLPDSEK